MWDGYIYATAINGAAQSPPALSALRLAGHASHASAALAIAVQALAPDKYWPTLLLGALLDGLAALAFHRLAAIAFPGTNRAVDRALLTAAFAVQPSLLAAAVQPGLDLPLVPAFLWCTVLMLEGRTLATILVGVAFAFTKETGVLLYASLLATYGVWTIIRTAGPARDRVVAALRVAPLATPGFVFCLYLLVRWQLIPAGEALMWNAGTAMINQSLLRQVLVPRIDRYVASYLAIVAVLNFAWVVTVFVTAAMVVVVKRLGSRRFVTESVRFASTPAGFVTLAALASTFALTRFASYANSRYLLPVIALSLVPFLLSLDALRLPPLFRRAVVAALALAFVASNVRTLDPVSRGLFGTFAFGDHRMLRLTSITHECCASGRDQLVYSLEFTRLEQLMSDALASLSPGDSTLIVLPDSTNWYTASLLDSVTNRRTFAPRRSFPPAVIESDSAALFTDRFSRGAYLALPNGSPDRGLALLARDFVVGPERRFARDGYVLSAYPLTARSSGSPGRNAPTDVPGRP